MMEIALHILDAAKNSIDAGAGQLAVTVSEDEMNGLLTVVIADDGGGMAEEPLAKSTQPRFTTKPDGGGRGLALLRQAAEKTGGSVAVSSVLGEGTEVVASFRLESPDCPPLGDLPGTFCTLAASNPQLRLCYEHVSGDREFSMDTSQLKQLMGADGLSATAFAGWLRDYLAEGLADVNQQGGYLD